MGYKVRVNPTVTTIHQPCPSSSKNHPLLYDDPRSRIDFKNTRNLIISLSLSLNTMHFCTQNITGEDKAPDVLFHSNGTADPVNHVGGETFLTVGTAAGNSATFLLASAPTRHARCQIDLSSKPVSILENNSWLLIFADVRCIAVPHNHHKNQRPGPVEQRKNIFLGVTSILVV